MSSDRTEVLPWHAELFDCLCRYEAAGRLAHAWLFQGPRGLGKGMLARHFAHYLLCRAGGDTRPCHHCGDCLLAAAGSHPDLRVVVPQGSRNIRIEQVRETIQFMDQTAQRGTWKLVLFQGAEAMNINAANALLKALEEPAPGTVLLLVSHHSAMLPATIRSRCQVLNFERPPRGQALEWLMARHPGDHAEKLLDLADGAPLRALALADDDTVGQRHEIYEGLLALQQGETTAVALAGRCAQFDLDGVLESLLLCVADLLRFNQSGGQMPLKDKDLMPLARSLDAPGALQGLHGLHHRLLDARRALASNANPNSQLLLESLLHEWRQLSRSGGPRVRAAVTS